jgi:hypothetical protein
MAALDTPAAVSVVSDTIRAKLLQAQAPLKLAEVAKGLPKPRKLKAADFQEGIRKVLEEEVQLGRAFCYPSANNKALRYWSKDEKQLLRDKALCLAANPVPLSALKPALGREVKGTDGSFVEAVVRELIGDGRLFEHTPNKKNGAARFGSSPPPPPSPPLEQAKHRAAVNKIADGCLKLLAATGVAAEVLLLALRDRLSERRSAVGDKTHLPEDPAGPRGRETPAEPNCGELILKAIATSPVLSLADLRREMPSELRGREFDEAILRLADQQRIILSKDADPLQFSAAERAEHVEAEGRLFTTISKWS